MSYTWNSIEESALEPVSYPQVAEGPEGNQEVTSPKAETRSSAFCCAVQSKLHSDREQGRGPGGPAGDRGEGSLENCRSGEGVLGRPSGSVTDVGDNYRSISGSCRGLGQSAALLKAGSPER